MTPDEVQTVRFVCQSLVWGVAIVLGVVLPWAASARALRIPRAEVGAWAPRKGWGGETKAPGGRRKSKTARAKKTRCKAPVLVPTAVAPAAPAFVWDQDALDAVAACRSLGFKDKEARAVVEELRGKEPGADCGRLAKMAIGRLGRS